MTEISMSKKTGARIESDERVLLLYDIVKDINQDTARMFTEIRNMRRSPPVTPIDVPGSPVERPDISGGATEAATKDIADAVEQGLIDPTGYRTRTEGSYCCGRR